jgi:hypothetical protein
MLVRELLAEKRSPSWRPRALWPGGGRGHEPEDLALDRPHVWPRPGGPGLGRRPRHRLPPATAHSPATPTIGAERADAGRLPGRGDPPCARRRRVFRRGLPQGLGAPALRRHPRLAPPRAAADARARPAGPSATGGGARPQEPRRHDRSSPSGST